MKKTWQSTSFDHDIAHNNHVGCGTESWQTPRWRSGCIFWKALLVWRVLEGESTRSLPFRLIPIHAGIHWNERFPLVHNRSSLPAQRNSRLLICDTPAKEVWLVPYRSTITHLHVGLAPSTTRDGCLWRYCPWSERICLDFTISISSKYIVDGARRKCRWRFSLQWFQEVGSVLFQGNSQLHTLLDLSNASTFPHSCFFKTSPQCGVFSQGCEARVQNFQMEPRGGGQSPLPWNLVYSPWFCSMRKKKSSRYKAI